MVAKIRQMMLVRITFPDSQSCTGKLSTGSRKIHVLLYKKRLYKLTVKVGNAIPILQDITHHSNASVIFLLSFKASRLFLEGNYV